MSEQESSKNLITINFHCSIIEFIGKDSVTFLNNFLISDLVELKHNKIHYTALCNPKGRIISSLWIKIINNAQILLICPANLSDTLLTFFSMRKFRLKTDISYSTQKATLNQQRQVIDIINATGSDINETSIEVFYQYMFDNNLPWIDANNSEQFIPQHVNLDQHENIMSFTKGCYPGQEIIARIKYLGKIKKRMQLLNNSSKQDLLTNTKQHEIVSPIIYNKSKKRYQVQVIVKS
jgi:folate-binding protein YgfZ